MSYVYVFVQIDGNGKFGDGIHRILDPLPYFALGIFVCQVSSVASPSCLNLNSQGEASLLLLGGATVVSSRSLPSSSFHGFPRAICHLLFIIFPVGSSWSISPNLFKEVSFHPIKHHHSAVQGASSHCALKAAKALLMIIRYSSVSPDHCAGTRNSICPLYWRKIVIRPDVLQTIPDCGFCIGFATSA